MLEGLVRPLLPANFRPAPWPSQRKQKEEDPWAELVIAGGSGQVLTVSDSWSSSSQFLYNDVGPVEREREVAPLRIHNPQDESQYVDTDQMEMMKAQTRRNQKTPQGVRYRAAEETDTVTRRGPNETRRNRV